MNRNHPAASPSVNAAHIHRQIGQNLRRLRLEHGLSQAKIAAVLGVSYQQVQKYERGDNRLCLNRLIKLCDFLGVSFDAFIPHPDRKTVSTDNPDATEIAALCQRLYHIRNSGQFRTVRRVIDALLYEE